MTPAVQKPSPGFQLSRTMITHSPLATATSPAQSSQQGPSPPPLSTKQILRRNQLLPWRPDVYFEPETAMAYVTEP